MPFQIIKYGENLNSNKIMSMHKPVGVSQIFIIQVTKHASSYKKIETFPSSKCQANVTDPKYRRDSKMIPFLLYNEILYHKVKDAFVYLIINLPHQKWSVASVINRQRPYQYSVYWRVGQRAIFSQTCKVYDHSIQELSLQSQTNDFVYQLHYKHQTGDSSFNFVLLTCWRFILI